MGNISDVLGAAVVLDDRPTAPADAQLADAIMAAGWAPPDAIRLDGEFHRFSTNGKRSDTAGWYVASADSPACGAFGCWRDGICVPWSQDIGRDLTFEEKQEIKERREVQEKERKRIEAEQHARAAIAAKDAWESAKLADPKHPYLRKKQVQPHGARVGSDGRLVVPMFDPSTGQMISIQRIPADGKNKRFLSGGRSRGAVLNIGEVSGATDLIYVAEGFATAATIREQTGSPVVVAFTCGNLHHAVGAIRDRLGNGVEVVIVADNDSGGQGMNHAEQAASLHGARIVVPPIAGDANDYFNSGGDLKALLKPDPSDWLVAADDFCQEPAPLSWRIKRWIQNDALIMIHGPSGGGKTFVALDMCCRISGGSAEWMGHKVRPAPVVYLAGEGHHGLKQRLAAWKQHHRAAGLKMWLSKSGCSLNTKAGFGKALSAIRGLPELPGLIVVDTLHRHLEGDENSAQDAKTMLDACADLMRAFGCSVLLVHHTGVNEEAQHRARGSSAWRGALDIEISVVPERGERPIQIVQRKSKDTEIADPIWVELRSVDVAGWTDEDGEQVSSAVLAAAEAPAEQRKRGKHEDMMQRMGNAVEARGEIIDGRVCIKTGELRDFLIEDAGIKPSTADQWVKPSAIGMFAAKLIDARILRHERGLFLVIDEGAAGAWSRRLGNKVIS